MRIYWAWSLALRGTLGTSRARKIRVKVESTVRRSAAIEVEICMAGEGLVEVSTSMNDMNLCISADETYVLIFRPVVDVELGAVVLARNVAL